MKFRKNEKTFIVTAIVIFLLLGIFLIIDVSGTYEIRTGGRERVGTVLSLHNDVRCIVPSGAAWGGGLRQGGPVMSNDTILTGHDSSAAIRMIDGTLLDMCEDSVITLDRTGDNLRVVLEKGCADVKRTGAGASEGTSLVIMACESMMLLKQGGVSIAKPIGGDPGIFVRTGEAEVLINGDRRAIRAGEQALCRGNVLAVEKKNLILSDPSENKRFFTDRETAHLEFYWEYRGEKSTTGVFIVEISRNRAFSPVLKREESKDEMISAQLSEGEYFWRVSLSGPEKAARETSPTGRFSIIKDEPFALLTPTDGERVECTGEKPLIHFTWEPHPLASSYVLELSDTGEFTRVIKKIGSGVVNLSCQWEQGLKPGESRDLYWRVTAAGDRRVWRGRTSSTGRFIVHRGDRLTRPRLVYPDDGKSMSRSRIDNEHLIFSWEGTDETAKKKVIFSRDKEFTSPYREVAADTDHWAMKKSFPSGKYFWRVGLYDGGGKQKAVSEARSFELRDFEDLALLGPRDGLDLAADEMERKGLTFSWKKAAPGGNYVLEISGDRDFNKIMKRVATESGNTSVARFAPGTCYWRVRMLNNDNTVAAASETRAFTVREGMAPPAVVFPRAGSGVTMLTENELKFSWKPMPGANAYDLELHQVVRENDKARDKLVLSTRTDDNSYTVTDLSLLDVGNFYWTLRAVKKDRNNRVVRASKKVRNNFNINLGDSKIIIVSPEIQVIEGDK